MSGWELTDVALATLGAYLILCFLIVPALQRALRLASAAAAPRYGAVLAVVEALRTVALALTVSAAGTWALLRYVTTRSTDATDMGAVIAALDRVRQVRAWIMQIETWGSGLVLALGITGLLYWVYRTRLSRLGGNADALRRLALQKLAEDYNNDRLPPLEPTEEMEKIRAAILELASDEATVPAAIEAADSAEDRKELVALRERISSDLLTLRRHHVILDLDRRVSLPTFANPLDEIPPKPRTMFGKIGRFFVSRGLLTRMTLGQRGLLVLNLLLAVPTVLAVASASIATPLELRIATLDDLRVHVATQNATQALAVQKAAVPDEPAQTPPAPEVTRVAYAMGRAFEQAVGRAHARVHPAPSVDTPEQILEDRRAVRSYRARRDVLEAVAARSQPSVPDVPGLPSGGAGGVSLDPAAPSEAGPVRARDGAAKIASALDVDGGRPLTPAGNALADDVGRLAREQPKVYGALAKAWGDTVRSFQEVARPSHIRAITLATALGGAVDGSASMAVSDDVAHWASNTLDRGVRAQVYSHNSSEFLATLLKTKDVSSAIKAVEASADAALAHAQVERLRPVLAAAAPSDSELANQYRRATPALLQRQDPALAAQHRKAVEAFHSASLTRRYGSVPAELGREISAAAIRSDAVQHFDDWFPPNVGSTGGGGTKPSPIAVERARSFARMRGFSRVGGVLIGRPPEQADALDLRQVEWARSGRQITLRVKDASGQSSELGTFDAAVVHLALGYAADGRPLTVTMTLARPLEELKILLHPALVDTGVGCRAISLDRFVDEALDNSRIKDERSALVQGQVALYTLVRLSAIEATPSLKSLGSTDPEFDEELESARTLRQRLASGDPRVGRLLPPVKSMLSTPELMFSPRYSILSRAEHFNARLVSWMEACKRTDGSVPSFLSCVDERARVAASTVGGGGISERQVLDMAAPVPTFEVWSGVREAAYRLDPRFEFVKAAPAYNFIVQVAFTSPPYQTLSRAWTSVGDASEETTEPWLFPSDDLRVEESVHALIAGDPEKRDVQQTMEAFTRLQRLFRAAFDGKLGPRFPLERLGPLATETRAAVGVEHTARWNWRPPEGRLLTELLSSRAKLPPVLRERGDACLKKNGVDPRAFEQANPFQREIMLFRARAPQQALDDQTWAESCSFDGVPATGAGAEFQQQLSRISGAVTDQRRLRRALGVVWDQQATPRVCGPL